jgi:hypothetical protein
VVLIQINFLLFLKSVLCFLETICTGGFITSTASENRFSLAVFLNSFFCLFKCICRGGLQLPACKNVDFYWPLALAVTINATKNRFTTASIDLLCTSVLKPEIFHTSCPIVKCS